ncbi:MAG: aminotransferase class V-fold PLP-dependent enzyme, partial [Candidatus Dadabacteria bacterium]|nr:aminotransferase class V-fold PLP-dependent enzyme [Candidatus Dadabacteria bacterium]
MSEGSGHSIYLDYNATTPLDPRVLDEMMPYLVDNYGNPSSIHSPGSVARAAIDCTRERVSDYLGAKPGEIVFTSGGSESNNFAIKGLAFVLSAKGNHLVTTAVEHASCLEAFRFLERSGFEVTYLPVDSSGFVYPEQFRDAITERTILASCMYVNNETGVISPIREIGEVVHERGVVFHTDAVQTLGKM